MFAMFSLPGKINGIAGSILLVFILSCNQTDHPGKQVKETVNPGTVNIPMAAIDTIYAGDGDTTVLLKNGEVYITGHIVANKNQPQYTFAARKGQTMTVTLKPLKKGGNVRINQIKQPGGAFDGPFGDSLSYIFKRSGNIHFIIGENLMAGDPYTGYFIVHIRLSEL